MIFTDSTFNIPYEWQIFIDDCLIWLRNVFLRACMTSSSRRFDHAGYSYYEIGSMHKSIVVSLNSVYCEQAVSVTPNCQDYPIALLCTLCTSLLFGAKQSEYEWSLAVVLNIVSINDFPGKQLLYIYLYIGAQLSSYSKFDWLRRRSTDLISPFVQKDVWLVRVEMIFS